MIHLWVALGKNIYKINTILIKFWWYILKRKFIS